MGSRKLNARTAAGGLAYIPSQTVVYKMGLDNNHTTDHATLTEPAIVPLISMGDAGTTAKVYYKGGVWWANTSDLYEVEE